MVKTHKLRPGPGCVLVEELDIKEQNKIISGSSLEVSGANPHDQLKLSRVLAVGPPKLTDSGFEIESPAAEGDIIAYQSLSAHKLRVGGKQYLLVEFEHIKAKVE